MASAPASPASGTTINCYEAFRREVEALRQRLPEEERAPLDAHVAACMPCREQRARFSMLSPATRAFVVHLPMHERAHLRGGALPAPSQQKRRRVGWLVAGGVVAATAFVLALLLARPEGAAQVLSATVPVEVVSEGASRRVTAGARLRPGDRVRTGKAGAHVRLLPHVRVEIEPWSELQVASRSSPTWLDHGRARFSVEPGRGGFIAKTPSADLVVKGTTFDAMVFNEAYFQELPPSLAQDLLAQVASATGQDPVQVASADGETLLRVADGTIEVLAERAMTELVSGQSTGIVGDLPVVLPDGAWDGIDGAIDGLLAAVEAALAGDAGVPPDQELQRLAAETAASAAEVARSPEALGELRAVYKEVTGQDAPADFGFEELQLLLAE